MLTMPFARYWLHNGMVNMGAEKMSKSLGNTLWIRELLKRHPADALRLWVLGTHYRNPLEYAEERLGEAERALDRLWGPVLNAKKFAEAPPSASRGSDAFPADLAPLREAFVAAMDDDFNTPQALGVLFDMARALNRVEGKSPQELVRGAGALRTLLESLGFSEPKPAISTIPNDLSARFVELIRARARARASRDWKKADELRAELSALDVTIKDTPQGTDWEWKGVRSTEPQ
jgi:cysteinyl-tRNA synthetase